MRALLVRDARADEGPAIHALVLAAFGREPEAELVDDLVRDGDAAFSLVAEREGQLAGHLMLSTMQAPFRALALAPVSVSPDAQGLGVGSRLTVEAQVRARAAGWDAIFVLGDPAYYGRFGFDAALAAGFASAYASPFFMALALSSPLPTLTGELGHAPAFARLDERSSRLAAWRNAHG